MAAFWAMGGYGLFVWSAYAVGIGILVGLAVVSVRAMTAREAELERLQAAWGDRRSVARNTSHWLKEGKAPYDP